MTLEEAIQAAIQLLRGISDENEPVIVGGTDLRQSAYQILDGLARTPHLHSSNHEDALVPISNEQLAGGLCYLASVLGGRRRVEGLLRAMAYTRDDEIRVHIAEERTHCEACTATTKSPSGSCCEPT